jgi:hypothetical protein
MRDVVKHYSLDWKQDDSLTDLYRQLLTESFQSKPLTMKPEWILRELFKRKLYRDALKLDEIMELNKVDPSRTPLFHQGHNAFTIIGSLMHAIGITSFIRLIGFRHNKENGTYYVYNQQSYMHNQQGAPGSSSKPADVLIIEHWDSKVDIEAYKPFCEEYIFDPKQGVWSYKGELYDLDCMYITNFNTKELDGVGHAIAGITCGGQPYLYNGWYMTTVDPATGQTYLKNTMPCPLYKFDWKHTDPTYDFCIDSSTCSFPRVTSPTHYKKGVCFNMVNGLFMYFLVRRGFGTMPTPTFKKRSGLLDTFKAFVNQQDPTPRPPPRNAPVLIREPTPLINLKKKSPASTIITTEKPCPSANQVRNPNTGRCVKACDEGKVRNPVTWRCVKDKGKDKDKPKPNPKPKAKPKSSNTPSKPTKKQGPTPEDIYAAFEIRFAGNDSSLPKTMQYVLSDIVTDLYDYRTDGMVKLEKKYSGKVCLGVMNEIVTNYKVFSTNLRNAGDRGWTKGILAYLKQHQPLNKLARVVVLLDMMARTSLEGMILTDAELRMYQEHDPHVDKRLYNLCFKYSAANYQRRKEEMSV